MTDEEKKVKKREYSKKYYAEHREEINAKQREWRKKDYAEHPEKYLSKCRKWQAENQDYMKAYHKAYAFTHARKARKASAEWRKENYEYKNLYGRLYAAKKAALKNGDLEKANMLDFAIKQAIATRKACVKKV